MFSILDGAEIKNLFLNDCDITYENIGRTNSDSYDKHIGIVAGKGINADISCVSTSGVIKVTGKSNAAGWLGAAGILCNAYGETKIRYCASRVDIDIVNCSAYAGGIVCQIYDSNNVLIEHCYNRGNIVVTGIVITFKETYDEAGGIVGDIKSSVKGNIYDCYVACNEIRSEGARSGYRGSIVGYAKKSDNVSSIKNNVVLSDLGIKACGSGDIGEVKSCTPAELRFKATFANLKYMNEYISQEDFLENDTHCWVFNEIDYPVLFFETQAKTGAR